MLNSIAKKRNLIECYAQGERNFEGLDLKGLDLSKVDLSNAILRNTNLVFTNLWEANLCNADLSGANLSDADLCGASLLDANLSNANITRTNFSYAGQAIARPIPREAPVIRAVFPRTFIKSPVLRSHNFYTDASFLAYAAS